MTITMNDLEEVKELFEMIDIPVSDRAILLASGFTSLTLVRNHDRERFRGLGLRLGLSIRLVGGTNLYAESKLSPNDPLLRLKRKISSELKTISVAMESVESGEDHDADFEQHLESVYQFTNDVYKLIIDSIFAKSLDAAIVEAR